MANKPRQRKHQAFLDDIKAVQEKHGLHLVVMQPPPEMRIEELPKASQAEEKT